jgi:hypothetical protein
LFIAISFQTYYRLLESKTEKREIRTDLGSKNMLYCSSPPLFIFLLWGDGILALRTTEHFHNARSLGVYSIFLLGLGLIFYGNVPLSLGRILEVFSLAIFGSIGYLTHLKVDRIL